MGRRHRVARRCRRRNHTLELGCGRSDDRHVGVAATIRSASAEGGARRRRTRRRDRARPGGAPDRDGTGIPEQAIRPLAGQRAKVAPPGRAAGQGPADTPARAGRHAAAERPVRQAVPARQSSCGRVHRLGRGDPRQRGDRCCGRCAGRRRIHRLGRGDTRQRGGRRRGAAGGAAGPAETSAELGPQAAAGPQAMGPQAEWGQAGRGGAASGGDGRRRSCRGRGERRGSNRTRIAARTW